MTPDLLPTSFVQGFAGALALLACLFTVISLCPCVRAHAIKMSALLLLVSLALFANYWAIYFATLFMVATSVTELEFLQNLAAIIRGNPEYFKYKIKQLSKQQVEQKIQKEQEEEQLSEALVAGKTKAPKPLQPSAIHRIVELEKAALDRLEEDLGQTIQRNIRFSYGKYRMLLDGFIPNERDGTSETFIEVKYLQNLHAFSIFAQQYKKIVDDIKGYMKLTNEIVKLHIVLITKGNIKLTDSQLSILKQLADSGAVSGSYHVFTEGDLSMSKR